MKKSARAPGAIPDDYFNITLPDDYFITVPDDYFNITLPDGYLDITLPDGYLDITLPDEIPFEWGPRGRNRRQKNILTRKKAGKRQAKNVKNRFSGF